MVDDGSQGSIAASQLLTDEQLLDNYLCGDRTALEVLVERHEVRLARIAYRITGCPHEAEDVRHSVFVRFLQSMGRVHSLERVGAWLTRCTVNEAVTRMRRQIREGRVMADIAQFTRGGCDDSPLQQMQHVESRERLAAALAKLTPDDRALLSLRFDENLTFREIAEVLDRPASTVKSQVSHAVAQLRTLLESSQ